MIRLAKLASIVAAGAIVAIWLSAHQGAPPAVDGGRPGAFASSGPDPDAGRDSGAPRAPEAANLRALAAIVARMTPGQWTQIPDSAINRVLATRKQAPDNGGIIGSRGVIDAWTGAAYDANRHFWYFHGGGHKDYSGNEVYRFDFNGLKWSRLTEPSPLVPSDSGTCPLPETGPPALHSYDGFLYAPNTDSIWYFTRRGSYCRHPPKPRVHAAARVWEFHPDSLTWTEHFPYGAGGFVYTAFDPVSREIIVMGDKELVVFDPVAKVFRNALKVGKSGDGSGFMDEKRRRFVTLGRRGLGFIDRIKGRLAPKRPLIGKSKMNEAMLGKPCYGGGIGHDTKRDLYVLWCGEAAVFTIDPERLEIKKFAGGAFPTARKPMRRIYSKWIYIAELDVFAGYNNYKGNVMLFRVPSADQAAPPPKMNLACAADGVTCTEHVLLQSAAAATPDNGRLIIAPGRHRDGFAIKSNGVTIEGKDAELFEAKATGRGISGKASIVIKGNDTTIKDLTCSGVYSGNLACIRLEGHNLVLDGVDFHDNSQGMLTGGKCGTVIIRNSRFARNGKTGQGKSHGIYVGLCQRLEITDSRFLCSQGGGHLVKSRAKSGLFTRTVFDSSGDDCKTSREIDIPNGGDYVLTDNTIVKGATSVNQDMMGFALEAFTNEDKRRENRGGIVPYHGGSARVENNTLTSKRGKVVWFHTRGGYPVTDKDNQK